MPAAVQLNVAVVTYVFLHEGVRSIIINMHFVLNAHFADCHRDTLGHPGRFYLVGGMGNCFDWGIAAIIDCFFVFVLDFEKLRQR